MLLEGVRIDLLDASGQRDRHDVHRCERRVRVHRPARRATYQVREHQPTRVLRRRRARRHARAARRTTSPAVTASSPASTSRPASDAIQYDFCEKPPGSISGRVHADTHEDCDFDDPEILLEGVADRPARRATATSLATTFTDADGEYQFTGLRAGRLPGPRASADRVLRRRRAGRHGGRRVVRRRRTVQHVHRHRI